MNVLSRFSAIARLLGGFVAELTRANFEVVREVLTPGTAEPAIIAIELATDNPWLITLFTNLVTLSPGTLTIELDDHSSHAYVHVLTTRPLDELRSDMYRLQQRVIGLERGRPR